MQRQPSVLSERGSKLLQKLPLTNLGKKIRRAMERLKKEM
jgi:hypothetical protein